MKIYLETENKNMAFKLNPPFNTKQSPIYVRDLEEGVMGKGKSQMSYDQQRASDFQKGHLDSAKKRKKEGSAFFMESEGQEKKDLMKYNPIDDRAKSPADLKKKLVR